MNRRPWNGTGDRIWSKRMKNHEIANRRAEAIGSSGHSRYVDLIDSGKDAFMSCWVAPSVAAEYWKIRLEDLVRAINEGRIPTRYEHGFQFVDIMPGASQQPAQSPPQHIESPPPSAALSPEELAALNDEPVNKGGTSSAQQAADEEALPPAEWREARRQAARRRIGPGRAAA